ncbi:MAG: UDP-N-acetylmuramate dehydrogenase [Clostridiales bacterium]|nr:UDP-N-acetylmuramate dehydrogenase [Clostridiales bacterium]
MTDKSEFLRIMKDEDCKILSDSPMSAQTTFKTGGNAEIIVLPKNINALVCAVNTAKKLGLPVNIIGNGSNLLVVDGGISGVVIKTASMDEDITVNGNFLSCSSGASLTHLCVAACDNSLTGLEFAYGIPGSVGGAVYMNAGAYGGEIKDVLRSVTHLTPSGEIKTVPAEYLRLGYRTSIYAKEQGYIVLSAKFELKKGEKTEIKNKMTELMSRRKEKQPLEFPSAGSTFKRPEGNFAGALIEQCGLKGFKIGGAQVSEKHAGFIVNTGGATSGDIIALINYVKETVKKKTGVTLEPEIKILP